MEQGNVKQASHLALTENGILSRNDLKSGVIRNKILINMELSHLVSFPPNHNSIQWKGEMKEKSSPVHSKSPGGDVNKSLFFMESGSLHRAIPASRKSRLTQSASHLSPQSQKRGFPPSALETKRKSKNEMKLRGSLFGLPSSKELI